MAGVTGAQGVPGYFVLIQCHFRIWNLFKIMHMQTPSDGIS